MESNYIVIPVAGLSGSGSLPVALNVTHPFQLVTGGALGVFAEEQNGQSWTGKTNSLNCTEASGTPAPTPVQTPVETPVQTPVQTPGRDPVQTPVQDPGSRPRFETPVQTPVQTPVETPVQTPEQTVAGATGTPEQSVEAATGTPEPTLPNGAMGLDKGSSVSILPCSSP